MPKVPKDEFPVGKESDPQGWIDPATYSPNQRFSLDRLQRLVETRQSPPDNLEAWQKMLLDRAIYSTYRDCIALGLSDEARAVLHGEEQTSRGSASA